MSNKIVRRGYVESDKKEFNEKSMIKIHESQKDVYMLLNRGYNIKQASTFVGNHYLLSERQRLAVVRATSSNDSIMERRKKEIKKLNECECIYVDGFNLIITLEVALSDSTLLKCMDGTIRDLAGLRGTYKLIDKTDIAIELIGKKLEKLRIGKVVFYLDSPVSNSGRLKVRILEILEKYNFDKEVELVNNADVILEKLDNVVTSDAIILDKCKSYINIAKDIIDENVMLSNLLDLSKVN